MSPKRKTSDPEPRCQNLGYVAKSPLNHKDYKAIVLPNGLRTLLISSCTHELAVANDTVDEFSGEYETVKQFNEKYMGIGSDRQNQTTTKDSGDTNNNTTVTTSTEKRARMDASETPVFPKPLAACNEWTPAAIVLTVGAGTFNDPEDVPGMAHYCEHCVFLGSTKYPKEGQLMEYLMNNNAAFNAFTEGERTNFYIGCHIRNFEKSLDMLTNMIASPIFPENTIKREIQAVDSEFHIGLPLTPWRYMQMLRQLSKDDHPIKKLACGNNETIDTRDIRRKLLRWKNSHYCADFITLTLSAPLPLDRLEELAMKYATEIPPAPSKIPHPSDRIIHHGQPFVGPQFHKQYRVATLYDFNWLFIHWALDAVYWKNFTTKPLDYIAALISHRGPDSLSDRLKQQGLATSLVAGISDPSVCNSHFCSVFTIFIELTETGVKNKDSVVESTLQYIKLLQENQISLEFYQEMQRCQADSFHYFPKSQELNEALEASRNLQYIPGPHFCTELLLLVGNLSFQFNEPLIRQSLKELSPEKANVMILSKQYGQENHKDLEPFYKTKFSANRFPPEIKAALKTGKIPRYFKLPKSNPFIASSIISPITMKDVEAGSTVLVIPKKMVVLHPAFGLTPSKGRLPLAAYLIQVASPMAKGSPEAVGFMHVWTRILEDEVLTEFGQATRALVGFKIGVSPDNTLVMILFGPAFYLPRICAAVLEKFGTKTDFSENLFGSIKDLHQSNFNNYLLSTRTYAKDVQYNLLHENYCSSSEVVSTLNGASITNFTQFIKDYRKNMCIVALLFGCVPTSHANLISSTILKLKYEPLEPEEIQEQRLRKLPLGEKCVRVKAKIHQDHTSTVINTYQLGYLSPAQASFARFVRFMTFEAFHYLRTTESLGYINRVYLDFSYGISSLCIEVSGIRVNLHSTDYVDEKIDNFLNKFYTDYVADFKTFQQFLGSKPVDDNFGELHDVVKPIFEKFLIRNSPEMRKLSTQVVGHPSEDSAQPKMGSKFSNRLNGNGDSHTMNDGDGICDIPPNFDNSDGYLITNMDEFRNSLEVYPNVPSES